MTQAVIRQCVKNPFRHSRKWRPVPELEAVFHLALMPRVIVDIWLSDYCREVDDVIGQWADDGGAVP